MLKEFLDFSYAFTRSERRMLFAFIAIYTLFAINVVPVDIPLGLALVVFAIAPVHLAFYLFSFYVLFENVSVFSFGITLNLLVQIILFLKILIYLNKKTFVNLPNAKVKLFFVVYFLIYGSLSFSEGGGLTGFTIALRMFVACYVLFYIRESLCRQQFWKAIFHVMYIATLVSVVYGIFNGTTLERYIADLESSFAFQLYGSLGTTRLGMFTVCSIIYPLYFVKDKPLSLILVGTMMVLTFMTVSMTAVGAMCFIFFLYFMSLGKVWQFVKYLAITLFILVATYGVWSKLSFVEPMIYRIEFARIALENDDMNRLTTGRADLSESYLYKFKMRSTEKKMFGALKANALDESIGKYSHNSYIDMLNYIGIVGVILMFLYNFKNVMIYRGTAVFFPIISLKIIMLVIASTVSVFTTLYWSWFIFI